MRMVMTVFGATGLVAALCGGHALAQAARPKALQLSYDYRAADRPWPLQPTRDSPCLAGLIDPRAPTHRVDFLHNNL
jgi:hypothetical protein